MMVVKMVVHLADCSVDHLVGQMVAQKVVLLGLWVEMLVDNSAVLMVGLWAALKDGMMAGWMVVQLVDQSAGNLAAARAGM